MKDLGTDHVSFRANDRPKKTASNGANRHTDGHGNCMTESAQWGRFSEKLAWTA